MVICHLSKNESEGPKEENKLFLFEEGYKYAVFIIKASEILQIIFLNFPNLFSENRRALSYQKQSNAKDSSNWESSWTSKWEEDKFRA